MSKKESGKNGLIELFRFLCSLWVAYYHGFSPVLSEKFGGVNISVDFFLMLSGFFFLKSIEKYRERPFLEGAKFIFFGRTKRFIVPLIIAALSVLTCNIVFKMDLSFNWPFSFLWFFAAQFTFLSLFYLIYKNVKKRSTFNIVCGIAICISLSLFLLGLKGFDIFFRSPGMLAMGMLLSQVPKINISLNDEQKAEKIRLTLNAIGFAISAIAFLYLAYLPGYTIFRLHFFICIVCTSLIYFATELPVRSKLLNFLGEFSVFVYLAQCPLLLNYYASDKTTREVFPWLCVYAVALFILNRIINKTKLIK